jgi:hypothetical protein
MISPLASTRIVKNSKKLLVREGKIRCILRDDGDKRQVANSPREYVAKELNG